MRNIVFFMFKYCEWKIFLYLCARKTKENGALAHLARAFDWQSKGDEFESRMLHTKKGCENIRNLFAFISL